MNLTNYNKTMALDILSMYFRQKRKKNEIERKTEKVKKMTEIIKLYRHVKE